MNYGQFYIKSSATRILVDRSQLLDIEDQRIYKTCWSIVIYKNNINIKGKSLMTLNKVFYWKHVDLPGNILKVKKLQTMDTNTV